MYVRRGKASSPTRKYGVFWSSLGSGSGSGNPMVPTRVGKFLPRAVQTAV